MEYDKFIKMIENRLVYRGRAMAFYEDGQDYGIVTVMSTRASHHLITSNACFVYSEANHRLIGTTSTGVHIGQGPFVVKIAPCGRKYILTCDCSDGQQIFIGEFF